MQQLFRPVENGKMGVWSNQGSSGVGVDSPKWGMIFFSLASQAVKCECRER